MENFINDAFQDLDDEVAKLDDKASNQNLDKFDGKLDFVKYILYYMNKSI